MIWIGDQLHSYRGTAEALALVAEIHVVSLSQLAPLLQVVLASSPFPKLSVYQRCWYRQQAIHMKS